MNRGGELWDIALGSCVLARGIFQHSEGVGGQD